MENQQRDSKPASSTPRIPLGPIQKRGVESSENEMKSTSASSKKSGDAISKLGKSGRVSKSGSSSGKGKSSGSHKKHAEKGTQAEVSENMEFITGEEPSPSYWRQIAETRAKALQETLMENEYLHTQISMLQTSNHELSELIEEARKLSEMIMQLPEEDDESPDESGIVDEDEEDVD